VQAFQKGRFFPTHGLSGLPTAAMGPRALHASQTPLLRHWYIVYVRLSCLSLYRIFSIIFCILYI